MNFILKKQDVFLDFFSKNADLKDNFYFSGGTALAKYYLQHRFSEDLDFFSEKEFDIRQITPFLKQAKRQIKYDKIDFQQSFNRNIFHLIFPNKKALKLEFTFFPFKQVKHPKNINNVPVDSLLDIAVNKVFTIYQNARGRDFYDLFCILKQKKDWKIEMLLKTARIKFDWHIDWLQFGTKLNKVNQILDDPIIPYKKYFKDKINSFFKKLSKNFITKILF